MGVDAVVFKSVHHLQEAFGFRPFDVDELTGEAILKSNDGTPIPRDAYFAMKKRIGNLAEIGWLRNEAEKPFAAGKSLILDQIVYSGSHSGDSIGVNDLPQLKKELNVLKLQNRGELQSFIDAMSSLLDAAEMEHNPIVFV